jgi:large subunit ribosomal protein L13
VAACQRLSFAPDVAASRRDSQFLAGPGAPIRAGPASRLKTYVATPATRERRWVLVDARGKTLGRLATQIANTLRGKRKPEYTPHIDTGDFVVVVNAKEIAVTGNKLQDKIYYRHSGYPGGLRTRTLEEMLARRPEEVIRRAVKGMLPRNRLGRQQLRKLKIYAGPDHPHAAQQPAPVDKDET